MKKKKILCFFGTRPEAIKMAPVVERLKEERRFDVLVGVSAQHRDMLDQVLHAFKLRSHIDLDLMKSGQSLFDITTRVLERFGPALEKHKPDLVLVHGDTTTTLGGALASFYKGIPVGHVEAGLRTHDMQRPFPEEANRRLTDALTTLYFCPTPESRRNILRENIPPKNVFVTGNTVIDALLETAHRKPAYLTPGLASLMKKIAREGDGCILMTAHRRENFGKPFENVLSAVAALSSRFPRMHWVYPVHPNPNVDGPARRRLGRLANVHLMKPLPYTDLVRVMNESRLVVTDSGGIQEEAPSLGKPVLVLRDVTERPEAVTAGTVRLVGTDKNKIVRDASRLLTDRPFYNKMANAVNPYGDGRAAERIRQAIRWYFRMSAKPPVPFR